MSRTLTPQEARTYIGLFRTHTAPGTTWVEFRDGETGVRRVWLDTMTDADALLVADAFYALEAEAAMRAQPRTLN